MSSTTPSDSSVRLVFRWWVIILVAIVGVLCLVAPFLYDPFGSWQVITSSTLTNVGTTMTFAAVLFFLERAFVRRVAGQARQQAQEVVVEATADLREENRRLSAKLSDLSDLLEGADLRREQAREQAIEDFENEVSFDTVARLLETANDLNAIRHGTITVPAAADIHAPRVSIFWGRSYRQSALGEPAVELALRNDRRQIVRLDWTAEVPVQEAAREFDRRTRAAGLLAEADAIDFKVLLVNFRNAVSAATEGRSSSEAWPNGRVTEWLTDDWAVTDQGVEVRDRGVVIPVDEFPSLDVRGQSRRRKTHPHQRPDWVDDDFWTVVTTIVDAHHARGSRPSSGYAPTPYTSQTTPRLSKGVESSQ
ncbi:hypothetical protein [Nocardioides campestrisoli]|uniref:hypothetical protein n=1 Tax=Nocardioides campestrisoli TaxID=2736757 RepID=UPI00163D6787|nr:hypothetical protein [Nocardioides campestrisoli]